MRRNRVYKKACTHDVQEILAKIGLRFNEKKCKAMNVGYVNAKIRINNQELENDNSFQYLGSTLSRTEKSEEEIIIRIGKPNTVFARLFSIWSMKCMSQKRS